MGKKNHRRCDCDEYKAARHHCEAPPSCGSCRRDPCCCPVEAPRACPPRPCPPPPPACPAPTCKKGAPCCCPGPVGPQGRSGRDGRDGVINSEFDSLRERRDIPPGTAPPLGPGFLPTGIVLAEVTVAGIPGTPARFLQIFSTFAAAQRVLSPPDVVTAITTATVPSRAQFFIETVENGVPRVHPEGAELSFILPNAGESGALNLRVPAGAGSTVIVRLRATADLAGIAVDVPGRPHRDNATLLVLETLA